MGGRLRAMGFLLHSKTGSPTAAIPSVLTPVNRGEDIRMYVLCG